MRSLDPDKILAGADDEAGAKYLLLDSSHAEELFCKFFLDLDMSPYQILVMRLLRGRFRSVAEFDKFVADNKLEWISDNGALRYTGGVDNEILLPAAHGKTTIVVAACTMEACDNPNSRTQLILKNQNEAFSVSGAIRRNLENAKLVEMFGRFKPMKNEFAWSNKSFSIAQREYVDIRDNFEFYGTNSDDALGKRSDRIISDDTETPDTARTPDACEKLIEWYEIGPMTSAQPLWLAKDGVVQHPKDIRWSGTSRYGGFNNLGTIFHPRGLHNHFYSNPAFNVVHLDCFRDKGCRIALDERFMPLAKLEEKRKRGILSFNKRYRNRAYDPAEMAFQPVWIRGGEDITATGQKVRHPGCLDDKHSFGHHEDNWELVLGFDPATGSNTRFAAWSAYVLLGFDREDEKRRMWLVDYLRVQVDHSRMLDYLLDGNPSYGIEGFLRYPLKNIVVEKNSIGNMLIGDDRTKPYVQSGLIIPYQTTSQNKLDPEIGVYSMAGMVQDGRLRIPNAEPSDQNKAADFIGEMELYPKSTNDIVLALWFAWLQFAEPKTIYRSWFASKGKGKMIHVPR